MMKKGNQAIVQVLIKWKNLPDKTATWEDWDTLKASFPYLLTWGQASSSPGGQCDTRRHRALVPRARLECKGVFDDAEDVFVCVKWACEPVVM
jgi:hypothetical protein